jgi:D-alanyl-D-alanine carboxypeptidase
VLIAFAGGFGLVAGAVYVSEHTSQIAYFFTGEVQVVGQGGPALDPLPEDTADANTKRYVVKGSTTFPNISAKGFLVGDVETGQIIASRQKDTARPIASVSKLMTALVADETLAISDETVISRKAASMTGTRGNLKTGTTYTIEQLFYPLLLASGNDAAEAIAEHENRYTFLLDMNAKADALDMVNTNFEDPSGLSAKNVSSPADLFALLQHMHKYRRYLLDITMEKSHKAGKMTWYSNSRFRNYENYVGGKNGYIDASGKTNVALFRLPLEGDDQYRTVAIILLNTRDAVVDTRAITTYLTKYVYYE